MSTELPFVVADKNVIVAEAEYLGLYRYRIWYAANADQNRMGKGARTYHAHVLRKLQSLTDDGIEFLDAFGKPINIERLGWSALYEFLGRKIDNPTQPGNLKHEGMEVLDAYFKGYQPAIARTFKTPDEYEILARVGASFFSHPDRAVLTPENLRSISGPYVCADSSYEERFDKGYSDTPDTDPFMIPVMIAVHPPDESFVLVHLMFLEPKDEYFLRGTTFWNKFLKAKEAVGYVPVDTVAYQGVGFPAKQDDDDFGLELGSILRDRATYNPYFTRMAFGTLSPVVTGPVGSLNEFNKNSFTHEGLQFVRPRAIRNSLDASSGEPDPLTLSKISPPVTTDAEAGSDDENSQSQIASDSYLRDDSIERLSIPPFQKSKQEKERDRIELENHMKSMVVFSDILFEYVEELHNKLKEGYV